MKRLLAIFTLLILTACAAPITVTPTPLATTAPTAIPSNTPPPTVTPTNTATPTITASPTSTATHPSTFGPSPTPSLTPTLSSWIEEDFLFGGPTVEGCELPCWQGLTPGVSTAEEADQVFTQIFGYGRDYESVESVAATYAYAGYSAPLMPWAGQGWRYETDTSPLETGSDIFAATAFLDRETYLLGAIRFRWTGPLLHYTPAMLIREFGEPSRFLIHISSYPQMGNRFMQFLLVYDEGIIYTAWMAFPEQSGGVEICLEGLCWNGQYDSREREIVLITPIGDEFPIPAHEWMNPDIYKRNWTSFEDKLGVPLAEVTETVQSGEPACWFYEGD